MAACQDVRKWMTKNVLMPVTQFITEARETCNNVQQWIEEQVQQPVDQWISQQEERCRNWPWPLNWLCEAVTVLVKIVVWVVVTVGRWVVTIVCQVVTIVIGIVITFVLQVVSLLVTFVVCIFTDPIAALKSFRDLWTIITDTVSSIFDFVDVLLGDVDGILEMQGFDRDQRLVVVHTERGIIVRPGSRMEHRVGRVGAGDAPALGP